MFVSGLYPRCPECAGDLTVVRESFDQQDGIYVGEQHCGACGTRFLYSRRPTGDEDMPRRKTGDRSPKTAKPRATAKRKKWSAERVNTHGSNGNGSESMAVPEPAETPTVGEAMRLAIEQLGGIAVDDTLAPQQLRELGEAYEEVARMQAAYDSKAEAAKTAKKALDIATQALLDRVKAFTHPAPLPLFDASQAESDVDAMLAGVDVEDTETAEATA